MDVVLLLDFSASGTSVDGDGNTCSAADKLRNVVIGASLLLLRAHVACQYVCVTCGTSATGRRFHLRASEY